jgi:hypothetical protein
MTNMMVLSCADVLREGVRLRFDARAQVIDANAAYLLVHNVMSGALKAGAKGASAPALDAALQLEIQRHFDPAAAAA